MYSTPLEQFQLYPLGLNELFCMTNASFILLIGLSVFLISLFSIKLNSYYIYSTFVTLTLITSLGYLQLEEQQDLKDLYGGLGSLIGIVIGGLILYLGVKECMKEKVKKEKQGVRCHFYAFRCNDVFGDPSAFRKDIIRLASGQKIDELLYIRHNTNLTSEIYFSYLKYDCSWLEWLKHKYLEQPKILFRMSRHFSASEINDLTQHCPDQFHLIMNHKIIRLQGIYLKKKLHKAWKKRNNIR